MNNNSISFPELRILLAGQSQWRRRDGESREAGEKKSLSLQLSNRTYSSFNPPPTKGNHCAVHGQWDGGAHLLLLYGLLEPEADERGQGVVQQQEHPRVDKVVPVEIRVPDELPRARAIALDERGDAKQSAWRGWGEGRQRGEEEKVWDIIPGVEHGSPRTPWSAPLRASLPSKGNATKSKVCIQCGGSAVSVR